MQVEKRAGSTMRRVLFFVLEAAVLVGLGAYAVARLQWSAIENVELRWSFVAAGFAVHLIYLCSYVLLWDVITRRYDVVILRRYSWPVWFYSLIGKYVPLKVGPAILRILGYKAHGTHAPDRLILCCYWEFILSTYAGLIVVAALAGTTDVIPSFPGRDAALWILLIGLLPFLWPPLLSRAVDLLFRLLKRPAPEMKWTFGSLVALIVGYALSWCLLGASLYLIASALRPLSPSNVVETTLAYGLAGFVGSAAIFAPSGLGVRDGALMFLLSPLLGREGAFVISVLARVVAVLAELAASGMALIVDGTLRRLRASGRPASSDGEL